MDSPFKTIALIGKPHHEGANQTLTGLHQYLTARGFRVLVESRVAQTLSILDENVMDLVQLGQQADLAIVVGGDGNMLGAARVLSRFDVAVIGVNRGNLGFLTDLSPQDYLLPLEQVLSGHYKSEHRFLLEASVYRHGERKSSNLAVNEAVLHPGKIAHMIEFEVYIDGSFMYSQRFGRHHSGHPDGLDRLLPVGGRRHPHPQAQCHHAGAHVPAYPQQSPHSARCRQRSAAAGITGQSGRCHAGQL